MTAAVPADGARLDVTNPAAVRELLGAVRAQCNDLIAAARDATAPPSRRDIGRREALRIVTEAEHALASLFTFADVQAPTSQALSPHTSAPSTAGSVAAPTSADDDLRTAREGWLDLLRHTPNATARRRECRGADLGTLLAYALGEPREMAEMEPLAGAVLGGIGETLDGWIGAARGSVASVSVSDLGLLARRVDVALELARREARVMAP